MRAIEGGRSNGMKERHTLPVLLLVFVVLAAGIVAAGCLLYRSQRDSCRTEAEHKLTAIANLKVSELSLWRKDCLEEAGMFYQNSAFSALVRRCIEQPQDLPLQEELRTWIGHFQATEKYNQVTLLDATCNEWMSVPDTKEPHSTLTLQKAREAMHSGQVTFADFYPDESTQKVYLRLFVPILDGPSGGRPLGVLRLRIDPEVYLYPFIQRLPVPSETAETLLIRREGNEAVFLNELKFQRNTALALRVSLDSTDLPAAKAALGQEGIMEGVDYRGVPVLAAMHAVPDSPWFLVAKIDAAEAYAPMRNWLWLTSLFVGVLLFGLATTVGFFWRQRHFSLYRQKYEAEHKYRAIIEASADGILMADVETRMLKYPNPALCRLLGYTAQELNTMAVADILQKDALHNSLAEFERLARDKGKGLTQDIPCLRKDGAVVYADINTTHATIGGRKCLVGVFRDTTERKRGEEALRETNEYLESLFNYANAPIIVWDPQFRITRFNHAFESLTGRRADEVIGESLEVLFPPPLVERSMERIAETLRGERWETVEISILHLDGSVRTVLWNSAPIFGPDGKTPMATIAQGQDITKRKQAEEALKRAKRQLDETASRLPGMIFQFYARQDGSLGLHYVSEQAKRLLGLDPEPKGFFERFTAAFLPEYRDDFLKIVRKTVSEVSEWKYEGAIRKPSGEIVWISGLASPTKRDDEIIYDGVIIDITERKKAEEKLLEFKAAVEQTVDGIALVDLDGHIRFVNGAWARMHGYSVDELIGRHLGIFHTGEQLETEVNPFIEQLLETGSGEREIGHIRRNGATFPAWMSCTVLTGADQKPCGLIGTALDISDRKRTQAVQDKLLARQQDINLLQQSLLEPIPLKEKLKKVTDGIVRLFDADFCRIWLIRPGDLCQEGCIHALVEDGPHVCRYRDRCLHLLASSGRYTHIDGQTHRRVPFGCYKIGRIASAEDHKFLTNDAPNDPRIHNHRWRASWGSSPLPDTKSAIPVATFWACSPFSLNTPSTRVKTPCWKG